MSYDYISPNLQLQIDAPFPGQIEGPPRWIVAPGQLEPFDPHKWFHADGSPEGWLNMDEAHILYNTALKFPGGRALEIGSAAGFSAWHILAAGMRLHMCDTAFSEAKQARKCRDALMWFDGRFDMHATPGHIAAPELGRQYGPWSLVLIDGDHWAPYPAMDAVAAEVHCAPDAVILLHDTCYDGPRAALRCLEGLGWHSRVYQTSRRLAVCWRGSVEPVEHIPDPAIVRLIDPAVDELLLLR